MTDPAAERVQQLVNELLDTRLGDLSNVGQIQAKLDGLQTALDQVRSFAAATATLLGAYKQAPRRRGRPPKAAATKSASVAPARKHGRPPGRAKGGVGEFAATPFILEAVRKARKGGTRPRDIVALVQEAVPGHHTRPSALVSTILTRLKRRGDVTRKRGKWYPT